MITAALERIESGGSVVLYDHVNLDGPAHLVAAATLIEPERLEELASSAGGVPCLALDATRARTLRLDPLTRDQTGFAFAAPVDARCGVSSGRSWRDMAHTMRVAARASSPDELVVPGHVVPICGSTGGVLERAQPPEAATELARAAGLPAAAAIGQIGGSRAGVSAREVLDSRTLSDVPRVSIAAAQAIAAATDGDGVSCAMPTRLGQATLCASSVYPDGTVVLALVFGDVDLMGDASGRRHLEVYAHSGCLLGDAFGSLLCGCGEALSAAMRAASDGGVVLYAKRPTAAFGCGSGAESAPWIAATARRLGLHQLPVWSTSPSLADALVASGVRGCFGTGGPGRVDAA